MSDSLFSRPFQFTPRLDRPDSYLRLQQVTIFVRDVDRSREFYLEKLGFDLAYEARQDSGEYWVAVSPPDGSAIVALVSPKPDSEEYMFIGRHTQVTFLAEDIHARFEDWSKQGVHFHHAPQIPIWGGIFTSFEDLDGNTFGLVEFDEATRRLEEQRRAGAERREAELRAARELEIAKQVQARLFPQALPPLRTLDYAGVCLQAREVGGDYYDFLSLGKDQVGLVIGDISGKGIAAALLMANLQANLRSQFALAVNQPKRLLRLVNQLFYESTAENAFATLFFSEYDDNLRTLRYVNCGHLSALLLREDGSLERLGSTGTVVGLFKEWDCSVGDAKISEGDILALYTDGITEAFDATEEEFGEQRLVESLRRHRELPSRELLTAIITDVQQFSAYEQHDDITLIVAKCRDK